MKKLLLPVILVLSVFEAGAQVYLTDAFKPEDSKKFEAITSKGNSFMSLAVYPYKGGFTLRPGEGGLIADHIPKVDDMTYFGKYVKGAKAALDQCTKEAKSIVEMKNDELDLIQSYIKKSVNVGPYKSTARVIILQQEAGDVVPATMQSLESFNF